MIAFPTVPAFQFITYPASSEDMKKYAELSGAMQTTFTWVDNPQKKRKVHYHAARQGRNWK